MAIAEEYERMTGWNKVLVAAGFVCDGHPAKVFELASLLLNDKEVVALQRAAHCPIKSQERMNRKLLAIWNDTAIPEESLESDLIPVLLSMTPQQRESLQARVVAQYQSKKSVAL